MTTELTIPEIQDRMLKVLSETVQYYCEDPSRRGISAEGACLYYDPETDNCCAVGRCLEDPISAEGDWGAVEDLFDADFEGEAILKEEYRGLPIKFWSQLQNWHDDGDLWSDNEGIPPGQPGYNRTDCCGMDHQLAAEAQTIRDNINDGYYTQAN